MPKFTASQMSHGELKGKKFQEKLSRIHQENRKLMIFQNQKKQYPSFQLQQ